MSGGADSCWPFTGARKPTGYGNFYFQGRVIGAHVAAFLLFIGDVPPDKEVDHVCHDPLTCLGGHTCPHRPCGNPRHLAAATHRENDMRSALGVSAVNAAKTHCLAGHEYTSENTYRAPASPSERHCRNCRAIRG